MPDLLSILNDGAAGLPAAALFFALFFATFVSEDAACFAAGTAVANGTIGFSAAVAACLLGIFVGDLLLFGVGRLAGDRLFDNRITRRVVSAVAVSRAKSWLEHNTAAAVLLSRFMSGLRLPTYIAAGASPTDAAKFALYCLIAAAVWTPVLVGSVVFAGSLVDPGYLLFAAVGAFLFGRLAMKLASWKQRRLMLGRLKRLTKWEFWPLSVFYCPVVAYVLFLAIRHRSLTVFTAANPAMPAGGFKGESKSDIYELLSSSTPDVPVYKLLPVALSPFMRMRTANSFIRESGLHFPLVLKPDAGERGKGVSIVRTQSELESIILDVREDMILQEYVDGLEMSVFYYRRPGEPAGHIFSMTDKQFPAVVGDGQSTLQQLILADPRAVCLAGRYLEYNRERLDRVPELGESVRLIDIGTHSRGAIFFDGLHLATPELEQRIDAICRGVNGFFFGRFDIRVPSLEALRTGTQLKIIELNGVTSESTNIYDPQYSLLDAYRILFRQWSLAFEIGRQNVNLGAKPAALSELLMLAMGRKPRPRRDDGMIAARQT